MDEAHLMAAVRYVGLNPVRARLVERARASGRRRRRSGGRALLDVFSPARR
jgi:hypothetical protein